MRHLNAHRKLGRTSEHRMSMLRNLATSLINARDERIITTVPKAKELRPFVERVITLAKRAGVLTGDDAAAQSLHLRRQAAGFFHAGNSRRAEGLTRGRKQADAPRTAGVAALKRLFDELGKRYAERPGGYTRIIRLGRRDGDNAELAIIELVDNPREREALESKKAKTAGKKKSAKAGSKAEASSAESTKKASGGGRRSKKTESTAAEQETE
ncbi:MAG TPA: 50S ribosomal protein L17 [Pyrinomonadaceae bacterium]|nr:50S ribosomal protein L17 [Pyrinomonadaceae bacterium]